MSVGSIHAFRSGKPFKGSSIEWRPTSAQKQVKSTGFNHARSLRSHLHNHWSSVLTLTGFNHARSLQKESPVKLWAWMALPASREHTHAHVGRHTITDTRTQRQRHAARYLHASLALQQEALTLVYIALN
eukprot:1161833-Pelagomonas_calceolata.AAC.26